MGFTDVMGPQRIVPKVVSSGRECILSPDSNLANPYA